MMNLVASLVIFSALVVVTTTAEEVTVTIGNGPIIGEKIQVQGETINRFLAIPYAEPIKDPESWFQRPRPFTQRFEQPFRAVHWPKACHQIRLDVIVDFMRNEFDTDCLQLNIWSPETDAIDESRLLPVFVFIHGGGLMAGSGNQEIFDGAILSRMANAVVVTINYRLTTFGLFYSDSISGVKGNQAFWDQAMALEWIQDNIRYFGGNPDAVTIAGVSAGSWSVSAHILSPISRKLFRNAYMSSGSIQTQVLEPSEAVALWLNGLRAIGCATDADKSITEPILKCLQQKDIEQIINLPMISAGGLLKPFVVVDGEFFPEHPGKMLEEGDFKNDVNLIVSTMEDEGSCLVPYGFVDKPEIAQMFIRSNPSPITPEKARQVLQASIAKIYGESIDVSTLERVYFNGLNEYTDQQNLWRRAVGVAYGDMLLGCPTTDFGEEIARHQKIAGKVYEIHGTYKLGLQKVFSPEWAAASHAEDQWPMFGMPFSHPATHVQRERDISHELISIIESFIRTGQPNKTEQPEWQSYFVDTTGNVITPYYEISNEFRTHKSYGFDLKRTECKIWKKIRSKV